MAGKKVSISTKPTDKTVNIDQWVETRTLEIPTPVEQPEKMKRLTIDIPEPLHRAFKSKAVAEGKQMADIVRDWVENYCKS